MDNLKSLDKFFEETNGYNDEILKEHGVFEIWDIHKKDYADYCLGKKIEKSLIDNGQCEFTAEL